MHSLFYWRFLKLCYNKLVNCAINESHVIKTKLREKFSFLFDVRSFFYYVVGLVLVCLGFLLFALLSEEFATPFGGDYAQQAYDFYYNAYDDWWAFFKTGKFPLYDSNTFLGADNIEANTYYGVFTPFLLVLLVFPRSFLPHAMVFMTIAKLVCGALLFRLYLKKMGTTESTARIFSFAYAFMGWTTYYLWFSTFLEVVAFFPLILLGIEKVIREKKIWVVALGFFCIGVGNYFFLLTFGIFGVIYAGFRYFQTIKERNLKDQFIVIGLGIAGFLLGILLCAVVTFPALLASFKIDRAESSKYWSMISDYFKSHDYKEAFELIFGAWNPNVVQFYTYPKDIPLYEPSWYYFCYSFPLVSYLFPAVSGRFVNIVQFSSFENVGTSIFVFTPVMLLMLPSLIRSFKNKKISHFIALAIMLFCLFTPFIYWLSGAFANIYGRWTIVISTTLITYAAINFDHRDEFKKWQIGLSGLFTIILMVVALVIANKLIDVYQPSLEANEYVSANYGQYLVSYDEIISVVVYQFAIVVIECVVFFCLFNKKYRQIQPIFVMIFLAIEIVVQGNVYLNYHGLQSMYDDVLTGEEEYPIQYDIIQNLKKNDPGFYRINSTKADEYHSNLSSAMDFNGSATFHTFYNTEVDDFIHMVGLTNHDSSWNALNFAKHADLEEFLGTKYYITKNLDTSYLDINGNIAVTYEPNMPLNFELKSDIRGYRVYENTKHLNFATSYDTLFYKHRQQENKKYNAFYTSSFPGVDIIRNEEMMFEGAILNDEDVEEIKGQYSELTIKDEVPGIKATNLYQNMLGKVYFPRGLDEYFDPANPFKHIKEENRYNEDTDKGVSPLQFEIVFEPSSPFEIGEKGGYYLLSYPVAETFGKKHDSAVWAIGEDDKVITFDDCRYNTIAFNSGRIYRAIYSKTPIKCFIICPLNGGHGEPSYQTAMDVYFEKWEDVEARFDKAIANGVENVCYDTNFASFTTNYEQPRFVTTQLAYLKGWKVTAKVNGQEQELKIYNSQGGFVGFVAPAGNVSYEMTYVTDGLLTWGLVSFGALIGIVSFTVVPIVYKKKKKKVLDEPSN